MEENNQKSTVIRDILLGSMSLLLLLVMILINSNDKIGVIEKIKATSTNTNYFPKFLLIIVCIFFILFTISLVASMILRFFKIENKISNVSFSSLNILNVVPIMFIFLLIIDTFFLSSCQIDGSSMQNTLQSGDTVLVSRLGIGKLKRGDIIIINLEPESKIPNLIVKRLWAKEGDNISLKDIDGYAIFTINGEDINTGSSIGKSYTYFENYTLKEGEIFVIGDHFSNSLDSRVRGILTMSGENKNIEVYGKLIYSLKPLGKISEPKHKLD